MLCSVWLVGAKYVDQVLDSLYVLENAMRHFYIRAEMGNNTGRKKEEVDEDYKQAAALAAMVAPYRHARLSAKLVIRTRLRILRTALRWKN
jgi:hypothetical protein